MKLLKLGLLAATSLVAMATIASAADLQRPILKAPPMVAPPFSWTGFYIGVHGGGAWGTAQAAATSFNWAGHDYDDIYSTAAADSETDGDEFSPSGFNIPLAQTQENGFLGGGQVGYNWQTGLFVLGVEGDISGTNLKGTSPCLIIASCTAEANWIATLAGRLGVAYDRALFYFKGGAAWADVKYGASVNLGSLFNWNSSVTDTRFGWMIGTGVEYAITNNLSAKIEYDYLDFGTRNYTFSLSPLPATLGVDIDQKMHLVKGGLNYHFSFGG